MNLELCVSFSELTKLPRGEPYQKTLMCRAARVFAPRQREFHSDRVFDLNGRLLDGLQKECGDDACVRVYFYAEWALAASFIEEGDILALRGFTVHNVPRIGDEDNAVFPFFVTPIPHLSTLRVFQNGIEGDVMEVMVKANALDVPCVRVLPKKLCAPFIVSDVN